MFLCLTLSCPPPLPANACENPSRDRLLLTTARPGRSAVTGAAGAETSTARREPAAPSQAPAPLPSKHRPQLLLGPSKEQAGIAVPLCPLPPPRLSAVFPGRAVGRDPLLAPPVGMGPADSGGGTLTASGPVVSRVSKLRECVPQAHSGPCLTTPTAPGLGVSGAFPIVSGLDGLTGGRVSHACFSLEALGPPTRPPSPCLVGLDRVLNAGNR